MKCILERILRKNGSSHFCVSVPETSWKWDLKCPSKCYTWKMPSREKRWFLSMWVFSHFITRLWEQKKYKLYIRWFGGFLVPPTFRRLTYAITSFCVFQWFENGFHKNRKITSKYKMWSIQGSWIRCWYYFCPKLKIGKGGGNVFKDSEFIFDAILTLFSKIVYSGRRDKLQIQFKWALSCSQL